MKRFSLFFFAFLLIPALQTGAQTYNIGFSPIGNTNVEVSVKSAGVNYAFRNIAGVSFSKELSSDGIGFMTEASYSFGKFDSADMSKKSDAFTIFTGEDGDNVSILTGMVWYNYVINAKHRVQFPLGLGFGAGYFRGGPFHHFMGLVGAKARVKFYITNNFGIFAGATYRYGFSSERQAVENTEFSMSIPTKYAEAGIIFDLHR